MKRIATVALVGMISILGCRTNMSQFEAGKRDAEAKVLIAGEDTSFKRKVVNRLIETLGTRDHFFRVIGLDALAEQEVGSYGAIVLLAGFRAGRLDARIGRFLADDPSNPRVIVFYTRGTEDPMPERSKPKLLVDSLSSASRDDRVERRALELADLVEQRLSAIRAPQA